MNLSTPRVPLLPVGLMLVLWLFTGLGSASAVHLFGGEMSYRYLGATGPADKPWTYEIGMRVYFNPATDPVEQELFIKLFNRSNRFGLPLQTLRVLRTSTTEITVPTLPGCGQAAPRVSLAYYVVTVNLPVNSDGYWATCVTSNRVAGITNLKKSVAEDMALEVEMSPGTIPNASPVFSNVPVSIICVGTNSFVANNAYDADGDELVYTLSAPKKLNTPFSVDVEYATGYSFTQPFGAGGSVGLSPNTGISTYLSPQQGVFQLAFDVREYRVINGIRQLLTTAHRDVQVVVRSCTGSAPNQPPAFTMATLAQRNFQLREGLALEFNIAATDPDGHPLTLTASSALLDGPGGIESTFGNQAGATVGGNPVGSASIRGIGSAAGIFRLTGCGLDRRAPYEVMVTATDEVCNSQTVSTTFLITVTRPPFPGASVRGNGVVCAQSEASYSVVGGAGFQAYQWSAVGGQILGPATGPTVRVLWGIGGGGSVRVGGITDTGCPTQLVAYPVVIRPGLSVTGPTGYCLTAASGLRYSVAGPAGAYQWNITDGTIVSGQGTNEVVVDITPGAIAALKVANPAFTSCVTTLLVAPDDNCLYFYNVITPNGDSQNDFFTIKNLARHPNTRLTVFSRWGQQVYHSDDYRNEFGGPNTAPGIYYYLCQTEEGTTYKGWFEVIR